ncbi:hypothetical protein D3C77_285200 [compost metagenome]
MFFKHSFHDLNEGYELQDVIKRKAGTEIVFDFWHSLDEQTYTVTLRQNNGSLYTGIATSKESDDVAEVTCRVFEDPDEGDTLIFGSKWKYPDNPTTFKWLVHLQGG